MYYSLIGILAVLVLFMVNRDILLNRKISREKPVWKLYRRFLFVVLAYYVTDITWGIFEYCELAGLLFADTTVYYIAMAASILYWSAYTVAYLEDRNPVGRFLIVACNVVAAAITALTLVNIFTPVLFTVDAEAVYTALPARYAMLGCQIALLLAVSVYAFFRARAMEEKDGKHRRYLILSAFGMIMALFLGIQWFFPYLPVYTIGYMLSTCMLHTFVANEEQEEYRREQEETKKVTELKNTILSLLNNMPGMTFTKDAETGVYLACNQAFAEYAHKENPDGVVGLTDAEIFDPETAAHFVRDDRIALSITKPYIFFEDVPDAAGNQRQFQTTKLRYTDISGRACLLGLCQDVTDMVRVQHENAMTQEAYETAVSSGLMYTHIAQTLARDYSDLYSVNTDTEEYVEYCRGEQESGLSEKRRGWHFFSDGVAEMAENVYGDDRESFRRAMNRKTLMKALAVKDTFIMTYRQSDGDVPVYVNMKVSRMENDEQFIIIGITNVDAEMRDAMAKSEVLAEALGAAEEANKARSAFLSSMSHEIRTPMNAIIGLDTLALKKGNPDGETREYLEKIGESARHLLTVINDILDMSRIESGHIELRNEPFSLRALLEQACGTARAQCAEKGLAFTCRALNETGDAFIGDETRIREVLSNILSNAVKFTEAGSVELTVEKTAEFEDRTALRFCVRDTGIGMEQDFIPRIFDPFSREDASNRNRFSGTGLGMAIARRLVEIMNGSVHVESEKGRGTEVSVAVTLRNGGAEGAADTGAVDLKDLYVLVVDDDPIEAEQIGHVVRQAGRPLARERRRANLAGRRVLLAEDLESNAEIMTDILDMESISTDHAVNGKEAVEKFARSEPGTYAAILMDIRMPEMDGLEAASAIRAMEREDAKSIPIIALTANAFDEDVQRSLQAGMNAHISKPVDSDLLIRLLGELVYKAEKEFDSPCGK